MFCVQCREEARSCSLGFRGDELAALVGEKIRDRGLVPGVDDGALMLCGEKSGVPVFRAVGGQSAVVRKDDKCGEIFVERTETVAHPCAGTGESGSVKAGGLEKGRLRMNAGFADDVVDPCDVVHNGSKVRNDFTDVFPALAVGFELPDGGFPRAEPVLKRFYGFAEVAGFSVVFDEVRFEVEQVQMARGTRHEKLDDPLRFCPVRRRGTGGRASQKRGKRDAAQSAAALPEEVASGKRALAEGVCGSVEGGVHGGLSWSVDEDELIEVED